MGSDPLRHELPNVAAGPRTVSVADLGAQSAFVVLLLMQSPGSGTCRQHAREIAAGYDGFRRRNATVAAVVPGSVPKVRSWRRLVDPPFPILADRDGAVRDAFYQPTRYGRVGRFVSSVGRVPMTVVLDYRGGEPTTERTYEGATSFDRPSVRELLAAIDRAREAMG